MNKKTWTNPEVTKMELKETLHASQYGVCDFKGNKPHENCTRFLHNNGGATLEEPEFYNNCIYSVEGHHCSLNGQPAIS